VRSGKSDTNIYKFKNLGIKKGDFMELNLNVLTDNQRDRFLYWLKHSVSLSVKRKVVTSLVYNDKGGDGKGDRVLLSEGRDLDFDVESDITRYVCTDCQDEWKFDAGKDFNIFDHFFRFHDHYTRWYNKLTDEDKTALKLLVEVIITLGYEEWQEYKPLVEPSVTGSPILSETHIMTVNRELIKVTCHECEEDIDGVYVYPLADILEHINEYHYSVGDNRQAIFRKEPY
jgi:hypothetical protein